MNALAELSSEVSELQRLLAQVDLLSSSDRRKDKDTPELLLFKRANLKFKMYQESRHKLPHIHIEYGRETHTASYAIDPVRRLAGNLAQKYERTVTEWISSHREKLLDLWRRVQSGGREASELVAELAGDAP